MEVWSIIGPRAKHFVRYKNMNNSFQLFPNEKTTCLKTNNFITVSNYFRKWDEIGTTMN